MRSMVEGCHPLDSATPLRQACGLPPPLFRGGIYGQNTAFTNWPNASARWLMRFFSFWSISAKVSV